MWVWQFGAPQQRIWIHVNDKFYFLIFFFSINLENEDNSKVKKRIMEIRYPDCHSIPVYHYTNFWPSTFEFFFSSCIFSKWNISKFHISSQTRLESNMLLLCEVHLQLSPAQITWGLLSFLTLKTLHLLSVSWDQAAVMMWWLRANNVHQWSGPN